MQAIAIANGDWSTCDSRHLTIAVWKSIMHDKLKNNINHIIQHQNSQVINKIFAGKKQNAKTLKSVQNVLDNPETAWAKMIFNPAPDPKKSHNSSGSDSKNRDAEQHWFEVTRDDHYLVCRLDIRQDSEFATGYGYSKTAFKWEPDPDIRNAFIDIFRIQTSGKSCALHNH